MALPTVEVYDPSAGRSAATGEPFQMLKQIYTVTGGIQARVYP